MPYTGPFKAGQGRYPSLTRVEHAAGVAQVVMTGNQEATRLAEVDVIAMVECVMGHDQVCESAGGSLSAPAHNTKEERNRKKPEKK